MAVGLVLALSSGARAQSGWMLEWSDEFDGAVLNDTIWTAPVADDPLGWSFGGELHALVPENVVQSGGVLSILSKREELYPGWPYTSGAVHTQGKRTLPAADFRIEIRARMPKGQGIWPALWFREGTMPFPDTGTELDLAEVLGHEPSRTYMTQHVWQDGVRLQRPAACEWFYTDTSAAFNVYVLERVGQVIKWYINPTGTNPTPRCSTSTYLPTQPSYLIMNTAIGGAWPGSPAPNTVFPVTFDIDYVRVYTKGPVVDAVVSDWSEWQATSSWSACAIDGTQYMTEQRTRTVLQPAQNGGATPPLSETRTVTQSCTFVPPPPPTFTVALRTCTLAVSLTSTPDGRTGWGVQYRVNGSSFGSRDTSSPFTATGSINPGSASVTAYWTKSGRPSVTQNLGTAICNYPLQSQPAFTVTLRTCTLAIAGANSPDGTTGWGVQYRINGASFGTRDTTSPFQASGSISPGTYAVTAYWTKTGALAVTQVLGTATCG